MHETSLETLTCALEGLEIRTCALRNLDTRTCVLESLETRASALDDTRNINIMLDLKHVGNTEIKV